MTAEEFSAEADKVISPAIERLAQMAFETVPSENVETLVGYYLDIARYVAIHPRSTWKCSSSSRRRLHNWDGHRITTT